MKSLLRWASLFVLFILFSCTKGEEFSDVSFLKKPGVYGTLPTLIIEDEPVTKATFNPTDFKYVFELGDKINIWSDYETLVIHKVTSVSDNGRAEFSGSGFTLEDGKTYYSSHPLIKYTSDDLTSLTTSYEGQTQIADGNAKHIADYAYTYSSATCMNGHTSFQYHYVCSFFLFNITLPEEEMTLSELTITEVNSEDFFAVNGKTNVKNGNFEAGDKANTMTLKLGGADGITVDDGVLNAYLAIAPCGAGDFVIRLKGEGEKVYTSPVISKTAVAVGAGKLFNIEVYEGEIPGVAKIGDTIYSSLAAAVAAVPADGTQTTITMIGDQPIVGNNGVTIAASKNVILDLNGKTISQTGPMSGTSYLIRNQGTLTIMDSSDTQHDGTGKGKMICSAEDPDTGNIPGYATNLISNYGILNIESGYFQELTNAGYASFVVDNYSGGTANISGGKLCNVADYAYVVRMFLNSTSTDNVLNISGTAVIEGSYAVWMQYANSNANKGTLIISGGTINATDGRALYAGVGANNSRIATNVNVSISGGTINGTGAWLGADNAFNSISVTGGHFADFGVSSNGGSKFVTGGEYESVSLFFQDRLREDTIVADGYKVVFENGLYYVVPSSDPREEVDIYPTNRVYYYWLNNDGSKGGGIYDFYEPFEGPDPVLMDEEYIELLSNIQLTKNVSYLDECSFGDPISKGGTFYLTFGEYDIDLNGYTFPLPTGVSVRTDKQTDIFSAAEAGYMVVETTITEGDFVYEYSVSGGVAKIGDNKYVTLEAAFAAAEDGDTIILLEDCAGNGIIAPQGKFAQGLTVDFNNHTYDFSGTGVGSNGTEYNGFQLLMGNTITFKDGTLTASSDDAGFLIQNYSNLTLDNMTLDGSEIWGGYVISNNNGNTVINNTTITAPEGDFAFDVCRYASYPSVNVTVQGTSVIKGNIEVYADGSDPKEGLSLTVSAGTINGNLVIDPSAKAVMQATPDKAKVIKDNEVVLEAPAGFNWDDNNNGTSTLKAVTNVAKIGNTEYATLAEAVAAVTDGTETTITMINDASVDVTGYAITIENGRNIILDLKGKTVTGICAAEGTSALIRNLGTLTINDSGVGGKLIGGADPTWTWDGSDDYTGSYASNLIRNEGTLIVNGGTLYNASTGSAAYAIDNYGTGKVTVNGGTVDAKKASAIRMFYNNGGVVTVNGGTVGRYNSDDDCSYMGVQAQNGTNAVLNVNGGTVAGNYAIYTNGTGNSAVSITGGSFDGYVMFGSAGPNTISISGGTFNEQVIAYGSQNGFITGGIYDVNPSGNYVAPGYMAVLGSDNRYTVKAIQTVITEASDGSTITLVGNLLIDEPIVIGNGKNIVLDLNGNDIYNTSDIWVGDNWSLISVRGGNLTITGSGALRAKENDCYAIDIQDGGVLTINGGTYYGNISAIYALEGTAYVNGGEFYVQQLSEYNDARYLLNCLDASYRAGTSNFVVSGGTFCNFNPGDNLAEGADTNFLANGHTVSSAVQDGNTLYTVQ